MSSVHNVCIIKLIWFVLHSYNLELCSLYSYNLELSLLRSYNLELCSPRSYNFEVLPMCVNVLGELDRQGGALDRTRDRVSVQPRCLGFKRTHRNTEEQPQHN